MLLIRKFIAKKNSFFRKLFKKKRIKKYLNHEYTIYYSKESDEELYSLSDSLTTNKGYSKNKLNSLDISEYQNYLDFYSDIFSLRRADVKKVFELGLGTVDKNLINNMSHMGEKYKPGDSLRLWRDYFYNALIFGGDIDEKTLFQEKRIKTFKVDQNSSNSIKSMWDKISEKDFDIIIDDGCHRYEETINFFENSFDFLKKEGKYIIEDILPSQMEKFLVYFKKSGLNYKFISFKRPGVNPSNNNLIYITKT
jgi:hypothetical protein